MADRIDVADYDLMNPVVRADPYPYYAALRDEAPIHRMRPDAPFFAISRYADVEYAFHHPAEFSSTAFQELFQGAISMSPNSGVFAGHRLLASPMMLSVDPPQISIPFDLFNDGVSTATNFNNMADGGEASVIGPMEYARLIYAALLGFFIFAEIPDPWTIVGALIIVGCTSYIARIEAKRSKRTKD